MVKEFAFIFYPGDYLRDTQCLSEVVQVAYDRIMCEHMRNICISQQQLNFFTKRLTPDQKEELLLVLDRVEDGYCIGWVVASINKRKAYSESRAKNREGKSKKHMNNISKTYVPHMENEIEKEIENNKGGAGGKIDFEDYERWTDELLTTDFKFSEMLMSERIGITPERLKTLLDDHLNLLARYPAMKPDSIQKFRKSALKHIKENKDSKNGKQKQERVYTADDFKDI